MKSLQRLLAPTLWRSIGAVLVSLGLVLPIASCDAGSGKNYHYALSVADRGVVQCQHGRAPPASWLCYADLERGDAVTLAALLWPLAALVLALRECRRVPTAVRIVVEPLLLAASLVWLYWLVARSEFDTLEAGSFAVAAGLAVGYFGWALELARLVAPQTAPAADADSS